MLDIEELIVNQAKKIIREKNLILTSNDIKRIQLAIGEDISPTAIGETILIKEVPRYLVIDLEATTEGIKGFEHEIIEIGATLVTSHGNFVNHSANFSSFVKPIKNPILSDFCKNLTNIKQEDVDGAPIFKDALMDMKIWLGAMHQTKLEELILCSWGEDKKLLKAQCADSDIPYEFGPAKNLALVYKEKYKKRHASLASAIEFFKMKFEGTPHRAWADAYNTALIFTRYLLKDTPF